MNIKFAIYGLLFFVFSTHPLVRELNGKHFVATYKECDKEALTNNRALIEILEKAAHLSGATVVRSEYETFKNGGFIATLILAEGHACVQVYSKYDTCFVDLFTVGTHCSHLPFNKLLERYLKPLESDTNIYARK